MKVFRMGHDAEGQDRMALRRRAVSGEALWGTLIASPTPRLVDQLAGSPLDFVFIDTEHVPLGRESLAWMCCSYKHAGLPPLVRVQHCDAAELRFVIDQGAAGVVAPYIETLEQVNVLCDAARRRPLQGEALRRFAGESGGDRPELRSYIHQRTADTLLLLNIESEPAIDRIDELVSVEGVDGVLIGPHDLSCNLGIPEAYDHDRFSEALREVVAATQRHGRVAAMHFMGCGGLELAMAWRELGFTTWVQHADVYFAARGVADEIGRLRGEAGASVNVVI